MKKIIILILNLPWSLLGIICAVFSLPEYADMDQLRFSVVISVKRLWICDLFLRRRAKGFTLGNVVLLSKISDLDTYNHEIIHLKQFNQMPFLFPIFYCFEFIKHGYRNNKYENEAYGVSDSPS